MLNRKQRRAVRKKSGSNKPKYSLEEVQRAVGISLRMNEATKGHLYKKHMNDKCVFCGAGLKARKRCDNWFLTFVDRMQVVLINPEFYQDDDDNAKWIIPEEYGQVKVPNGTN